MKIALFSAKGFEKTVFEKWNAEHGHELEYIPTHLDAKTAVLAQGSEAVCAFVSDVLDEATLETLVGGGCRLIVLRSAGFNHVDRAAAARLKLPVLRVPAYSPNAIAEHTVALMLSLNRSIHKAFNRVRDGNFSLEGLMGFDLAKSCVGVVGTGHIGTLVAKILKGFGAQVLAFDPKEQEELKTLGITYRPIEKLLQESNVVTLHCPLNEQTHHLINEERLKLMRPGAMLINTGRGALIDTKAVIGSLKNGHLGYLGLDVYEEEEGLFFEDCSDRILLDDVFARLLTFPNVLITGHQAFLTREAMDAIAKTTLQNVSTFEAGKKLENQIPPVDAENSAQKE